jgi:hypothetical protein
MMLDSFPIMNHGSMFDGVLGPPASKPGSNFVRAYHIEKRKKWRM